jgi:hypothetical protein
MGTLDCEVWTEYFNIIYKHLKLKKTPHDTKQMLDDRKTSQKKKLTSYMPISQFLNLINI